VLVIDYIARLKVETVKNILSCLPALRYFSARNVWADKKSASELDEWKSQVASALEERFVARPRLGGFSCFTVLTSVNEPFYLGISLVVTKTKDFMHTK
jgi:hypothetical protein